MKQFLKNLIGSFNGFGIAMREMLSRIRPNLILGLIALVMITWHLIGFAENILTADEGSIIKENANVVLVGLFGLLSSIVGGVVGYAMGLKEALTSKRES